MSKKSRKRKKSSSSEKTMKSKTPYDDAFKTLVTECGKLVIPLVNEVFGKDYSDDSEVTVNPNEHIKSPDTFKRRKRIADSSLMIRNDRYIVECQSVPDGSMIVRMFEYSILEAIDSSAYNNYTLHIAIPDAVVLFLRSNDDTPEKMNIIIDTPGGSVEYDVRVVCMKNYGMDYILEKKLYILLPFYIFTFEPELDEYNNDSQKLDGMIDTYRLIFETIKNLTESQELDYYNAVTIIRMIRFVFDNLTENYENVKEVTNLMGGRVLDYPERRAYHRGIAVGEARGELKGETLSYIKMIMRKHSRGKDLNQIVEEMIEDTDMNESDVRQIYNFLVDDLSQSAEDILEKKMNADMLQEM